MEASRVQPNTVVLVSGGMDSATLLAKLLKEGVPVSALTIHYGQRHKREIEYAKRFCEHFGVPHTVCDLGAIKELLKGSSQTDDTVAVPEGHYEDPVMRLTVVPNRNMILLAAAAAFAIGQGAKNVAYAAHAGDHAIYPDCRPEFMNAFAAALRLCHYDGGVELITPFANYSKANIAAYGRYFVPYELTYSCYAGRPLHCGLCGTCVERRMAFSEAGFSDPVDYECSMFETLSVIKK